MYDSGDMADSVIQSMIFDVDGTLLDSRKDIADAQQWVLRQLGIDLPDSRVLFPFIGKSLSETFRHFLPPDRHPELSRAMKMYRDYYRPRALETTVPFPSIMETLEKLRARGIPMAVATTKSSPTAIRILSHFDLDGFFVQIQGTEDFPPKPNPAVVRRILRQQQWSSEGTLMVGDSREDIDAGKAAGVQTCAVTYGALDRDQLTQFSPDYLVDSFSELLSLI